MRPDLCVACQEWPWIDEDADGNGRMLCGLCMRRETIQDIEDETKDDEKTYGRLIEE